MDIILLQKKLLELLVMLALCPHGSLLTLVQNNLERGGARVKNLPANPPPSTTLPIQPATQASSLQLIVRALRMESCIASKMSTHLVHRTNSTLFRSENRNSVINLYIFPNFLWTYNYLLTYYCWGAADLGQSFTSQTSLFHVVLFSAIWTLLPTRLGP